MEGRGEDGRRRKLWKINGWKGDRWKERGGRNAVQVSLVSAKYPLPSAQWSPSMWQISYFARGGEGREGLNARFMGGNSHLTGIYNNGFVRGREGAWRHHLQKIEP